MDVLINKLQNTPDLKICFFVGAGISVAAGIPDFRSPSVGLYSSIRDMKHLHFHSPTFVFDIGVFKKDPRPFWWIFTRLWPRRDWPLPTDFHYMMSLLAAEGKVSHIFSQNVDGLELSAGVDPKLMTAGHGVLDPCICLRCRHKFPLIEILPQLKFPSPDDYELVEPPKCPKCNDNHVKPSVVFFGESLPSDLFINAAKFIPTANLAIIAGTSLEVQPFASLPDDLKCPKFLINREKVREKGGILSNIWAKMKSAFTFGLINSDGLFDFEGEKDFFIGGDLQDSAKEIIRRLGLEEKYLELKTKVEAKHLHPFQGVVPEDP